MRTLIKVERARNPEQGGYILPFSALLLVPLMVFAALAVDVGSWYVQAAEAQVASDAAALAGVVWMPDQNKAADIARAVAARNGFPDQPGCDGTAAACVPSSFPQVVVNRVSDQQLRVDIFTEAGFYFGKVVGADDAELQRNALAEYVLPVPMGNPTSALGIGTDVSAGGVVSNYWLRAMPECEPRSTGDFIGAGGSCPTHANPNYRAEGHTFIVEVPIAGAYQIQARTTCAEFGGQQANASMRFKLFNTDSTPLDDNDNVLSPPLNTVTVPRPSTAICPTNGSGWSTAFDPAPWVTIGSVSNAGRYVLQAKNPNYNANIRSLYSLRIVPAAFVGSWSCSRVGPTGASGCPSIFGKDYLTAYTHANMFAGGTIGSARLYLAEIDEDHAGKIMQVELFDPADGIDNVKIVDPHGNHVDFTWYSTDCLLYGYLCGRGDLGTPNTPIHQTCSGVPCLKQDVGISFQDRSVKISIPLPVGYTCKYTSGEPDDCWWKVEYQDTDANANETTTWGVTVAGDPVRLIG